LVLNSLQFKPANEDIELVLQLGLPHIDEEKLLDDALDFPENFAKKNKKNMIVFIDEFQEIIKIGGIPLLKKMRAKFQKHEHVTYIFAGSQESIIRELFQSKQHAFYRFGRIFEVEKIEKKDFSHYILKTFKKLHIQLTPSLVREILNITDGHPYYTQLLCQMIYIDCLTNKKDAITQKDVQKSMHAVVRHELAYFDEVWKELGKKRFSQRILLNIAQHISAYMYAGTSKENIARILGDLRHHGHLQKIGQAKNTRYLFKDPFFKQYIVMKLAETKYS